tara:strand:+ start:365 stop:508 length:144 start_codon:yes stop_codon:yes gene_type:complete
MCVGRQIARWIFQDYISTDARVWAVGVKADSLEEQIAAILEPGDLVI